MKPWLWMTLCLGCLAAAGCRTPHRTTLEQESRQWEERYYIAQDRLDECRCMLDAVQDRNRGHEESGGRFGPSGSPDAGRTPADLTPPNVQMPDGRFQMSPPGSLKLEPPGGIDREGSKPPSSSPPQQIGPDSDAPPYNPEPAILPGPQPDAAPGGQKPDMKLPLTLSGDSREVDRVELIGMSSDGFNADGRPGDEGIQFVLQPRDSDGRAIDVAGPVSVVVVDPLPAGKSVRVARWDLSAGQTAGYYDRSPQGFHLRLPWPSTEPKHSRLRLFARYTASDGRVIEAEKAIEVNLPGQQTPQRTNQQSAPLDKPRVAVKPPRQRPAWSPERR